MRCAVCLRDTNVLHEYGEGEFMCTDCHEAMTQFCEEFAKSGLTEEQFFRRKVLDFIEKRFSRFARGN